MDDSGLDAHSIFTLNNSLNENVIKQAFSVCQLEQIEDRIEYLSNCSNIIGVRLLFFNYFFVYTRT